MTSRNRLLIALALVFLVVATLWGMPKLLRRMEMQGLRPVTVASGLDNPWALAFLPDGRMLVTERIGRMRLVARDGALSAPLRGLPPVFAQGEGGLMDVALDPQFAKNGKVYWSYSEPDAAGTAGSSTAVASGRLAGMGIEDVMVIFRQAVKVDNSSHYGSRLLFAPDGRLFVSLGDRSRRDEAQDMTSSHGKILRMETDGRAPPDNPHVQTAGALPQVWTLGHRNVQGLAIDPVTGALWASEHGPQGGDELNLIERGRNYGWPVITYGCEYASCARIGEGTPKDGMEQPVVQWSPQAIAPTGMVFLTSDRYPGWKGDLFIGMLQGRAVLRLKLEGQKVVEQERLLTGLMDRVRDVRQGPDGWLYILTGREKGRILRIER
ncbi:MAG: PQQ-dependent sugar dehydrogenase [Betaproteobacteria bacterium]|nr:PQQ-dependent sugar dehydrogenase [Betaproteobacteria bacterium]